MTSTSRTWLKRVGSVLRHRKRRKQSIAPTSSAEVLETRILPATIVVNNLSDHFVTDYGVTLREALTAANNDTSISGSVAGDGADTIVFERGLTGTIVLTGGPLEIRSNVTIAGPGSSLLFVDGNAANRVLNVTSLGVAHLSGLRIQNGLHATGAGINNDGTMTLINSDITGNNSTSVGGGIYNSGSLQIANSAVFDNHATSSVNETRGGGIYNSGVATIEGTSIYTNTSTYGSGIGNQGTIDVNNTTIALNEIGFTNFGNGLSTIVNSTIVGNTRFGVENDITVHPITIHNSIIALNDNIICCDIFPGPAGIDPASSNNLIGSDLLPSGLVDGVNGNQVGTSSVVLNPMLLPQTHGTLISYALQPGSPAIDAGSDILSVDASDVPSAFDQIGAPRKIGTVDIGAVEANPDIAITFSNDQHVIQLNGTSGDDAIVAVPGLNSTRLTINQTNHKLNTGHFINPRYVIDSGDGVDQVRVYLPESGPSDAVLNPADFELTFSEYSLYDVETFSMRGLGAEHTTLHTKNEFSDVQFFDSFGDDVFVARQDLAFMVGPGFSNSAHGFEDVDVRADEGNDIAQLRVDGGLDMLMQHPRFAGATSMASVFVEGIRDVTAWYEGSSNQNNAELIGSDGDDRYVSRPHYAMMQTPDSKFTLYGANNNYADGGSGGRDTAQMYDSPGDDYFTSRYGIGLWGSMPVPQTLATMSGNEFINEAEGFDVVIAHSSAGHDQLIMFDSPGDDAIVVKRDYATFRRMNSTAMDDFYVQANGFSAVRLEGGRTLNDHDRLFIYDSLGSNHLVVQPDSLQLDDTDGSGGTPAWTVEASEVAAVYAYGESDDQNTIEWNDPLEYAFTRIGNWEIN